MGGGGVRPFGIFKFGEGIVPLASQQDLSQTLLIHGQRVGVGILEFFPHLIHQLMVYTVVDVTQRNVGFGGASDRHMLHMQVAVADAPADQRGV